MTNGVFIAFEDRFSGELSNEWRLRGNISINLSKAIKFHIKSE